MWKLSAFIFVVRYQQKRIKIQNTPFLIFLDILVMRFKQMQQTFAHNFKSLGLCSICSIYEKISHQISLEELHQISKGVNKPSGFMKVRKFYERQPHRLRFTNISLLKISNFKFQWSIGFNVFFLFITSHSLGYRQPF